jgi:hypothetical protein
VELYLHSYIFSWRGPKISRVTMLLLLEVSGDNGCTAEKWVLAYKRLQAFLRKFCATSGDQDKEGATEGAGNTRRL